MTCYQVQRLMDLYIGNDPSLTVEKRKAFDAHLHNCRVCARKHEESQWIVGLVRVSWPYEQKNRAFLKRINQPDQRKEVIEQCWQELKCRIPEFTPLEKERKYLPLFQRIGAFAACLIIGISVFLAFSYLKPKITREPAAEHVVSTPKPSLKVELVSENGNMLLPYSHRITATKELKNLIINDKHRMVMNVNTTLSIEPLVENSKIGCFVKLDSGQIYTKVEHDRNPFAVDTAQGNAVITGTTFDVKVTDDNTTLVVCEGTVQFESENGVVNVTAGQTSKIVAHSAPTKAVSCNTTELTAWATGYKAKPTLLVQIASYSDVYSLGDLGLPVMSGSINLESIDYKAWVEEKRDWFKREFPWIFQLKDALAKEGIEVDYPELLMKSGDVWQFVYPKASPGRITVLDSDSLLKTTSHYGFNQQWLLENIPAAKSVIGTPLPVTERFVGTEAFEKWSGRFEDAQKAPRKGLDEGLFWYSLRASVYLAHTRALAWLGIKNGQLVFKTEDRVKVLALLETEVETLNDLSQKIFDSVWTNRPCDKRWELLDKITEDISEIMSIEEKINNFRKGLSK